MKTRNQGLAQPLQTSALELSRWQTEISRLRTSVERSQYTENRAAENHWNMRKRRTSPWVGSHRPRFNVSSPASHAAEMETERTQPLWEDAPTTLKRWSYAAEECAQQVSGQVILLHWLPHTPLETHRTLLFEIVFCEDNFFISIRFSPPMAEGNLMQKEQQRLEMSKISPAGRESRATQSTEPCCP